MICRTCKLEKNQSDFPKDKTRKTGYRLECKKCHNTFRAEKYKTDPKYKIGVRKRTNKRRKKNFRFLQTLKRMYNCEICGENNHLCLDFHHKDPATKIGNIRNVANDFTLERLKQEIRKCILLCSNCHRCQHINENRYLSPAVRYVRNLKKNSKCKYCEENRWTALEFHHRNPDEKLFSIGAMVEKINKKNIDVLKQEIKKCDIICTACHRTLHQNEQYNL